MEIKIELRPGFFKARFKELSFLGVVFLIFVFLGGVYFNVTSPWVALPIGFLLMFCAVMAYGSLSDLVVQSRSIDYTLFE